MTVGNRSYPLRKNHRRKPQTRLLSRYVITLHSRLVADGINFIMNFRMKEDSSRRREKHREFAPYPVGENRQWVKYGGTL